MQKSNVFLLALGGLLVTAIVITALVMPNKTKNDDRFTVAGSGTVYAKADIANIEIGLKTEAKKTAAEATTDSTDKMNSIVKELKKIGIEEKDIKTTNYNLQPVYNWTQDKGQELKGYEVYQNLSVKVRDLNKIGDVIAKTTEKGANQIGNVNFTIDDEFSLRNQARELAIQKAKEKAQLIAKQTGMKLGEVKGVFESEIQPSPIMYSNARKEMSAGVALDMVAAPEIQTGQNEIKVDVNLVYEVK